MNTKIGTSFGLAFVMAIGVLAVMLAFGLLTPSNARADVNVADIVLSKSGASSNTQITITFTHQALLASGSGQITVTYTRARAPYVAEDDFTLRITRKNVFTRIAEMFGFYGLLVGDEELERKYKIKSSNDLRARSLMSHQRLRELIMVQPSLRLDVRRRSWGKRRKTGPGVREVTVQTTGVIKEPERLVNYVSLVVATLEQLAKIGEARYEQVAENRTYALRQRP